MRREKVDELLRQRIGLDPDSTGPGLAARAVRARMKALGIAETQHDRYVGMLEKSSTELQALVEEVVIPESWFFRDEHPFSLFADRYVGLWLTERTLPKLRVLSIPCARGEESYSIAMILIDRGLSPDRFRVDAVDVSRVAVEFARRGVYSDNSFRTRDLTFRDRHFQSLGDRHQLKEGVRSSVTFQVGNLLDESIFAGEGPFDAIFCRNLLIYLDGSARRQALANLDRLLAPSGLLIVGHAEQIGYLGTSYRPAGDRKCFAFEREATAARPSTPKPWSEKRKSRVAKERPPRNQSARVIPPPPNLPSEDKPSTVVTGSCDESALERASALANQGSHEQASILCERQIAQGSPTSALYFLLGLIRQADGDRVRALDCFEKTVYLEPDHEEALLALALLAERRGDLNASKNFRGRAERAYQEKHPR